ncbi:four-helix bundle copper-binding protein [Pseudomonas aeruginosa]|uniref:four-helix bundle copper-binding protein n=1 Tax=Pseudomonas aeruginosa TaxID=287 RepID=UPI001CA5C3B3|nr:four-helix bundle copper-binding protein [Pseudomonas aeruginosa]
MPPPRRRKSAAGSQPRPASARASATWRSASSPAGNNASTPATAPTSAASLPCCWKRRSPWAPAACELAARYALACAERCDGDEPLERECAGACRRFVEACRPLLPA